MTRQSRALKARTYLGNNLKERKEKRRKALIEAGLELFGTKGYRSCSVKMVCDRAKLTERYFYESFANREALLVGLLETLIEDIASGLQDIVESERYDDDGPKRMKKFIDFFYHYVRDDQRRGRIVLSEILGVSPQVDWLYQSAVRGFAASLEHPNLDLFGKTAPPKSSRRIITTGLVGAMLQVAVQWLLEDFKTPPGRVTNNTLEVFLAVSDRYHR